MSAILRAVGAGGARSEMEVRAERFSRVTDLPRCVNYPLLGAFQLSALRLVRMQAFAGGVLAASMEEHQEDVLRLPNVTPNGALKARQPRESKLLRGLAEEIYEALATFRITHWSEPPILRVVDGRLDGTKSARPYSTDKLHTDVWVGEPRGMMNVIIPLLGEGVEVEFCEPRRLERFEPIGDYNEAGAVDTVPYAVSLQVGRAYFFDSACLHRTARAGSGLRISVDLRGLYAEQLEIDASPWAPASKYTRRSA